MGEEAKTRMANDTGTGSDSETRSPSTKRRLRSSPETIRARTARLSTPPNTKRINSQSVKAPSEPNVLTAFWGGFTWPLRKIGRGLAWVGRLKPVRILGRVLFPRYFRRSWQELRLVTWPSRKQSWKLTYAVIVFSVLFGAIVALVDFGLDKLFKEFIIK